MESHAYTTLVLSREVVTKPEVICSEGHQVLVLRHAPSYDSRESGIGTTDAEVRPKIFSTHWSVRDVYGEAC